MTFEQAVAAAERDGLELDLVSFVTPAREYCVALRLIRVINMPEVKWNPKLWAHAATLPEAIVACLRLWKDADERLWLPVITAFREALEARS